MDKKPSIFEQLSAVNVNNHTEKKGNFTYLSWTFAVAELRKVDPTATWEVVRFNGLPFLTTEFGVFVEASVTVQGVTLSQIHPVLDGKNKPISNPDAFQINTSIQRAIVKAMALHGLGLYIYAGEDLPEADKEAAEAEKIAIKDKEEAEYKSLVLLFQDAANKGTDALTEFGLTIPDSPVKARVRTANGKALAAQAAQANKAMLVEQA